MKHKNKDFIDEIRYQKIDKLISILSKGRKSNRITPEKPICGPKLCEKIKLESDVELRSMVNECRSNGVAIASVSNGYFLGMSKEEIQSTLHHLTHRVSGINKAIRGLKKAKF